MDKLTQKFYLPASIVVELNRRCKDDGCKRSEAVAAALLHYVEAAPAARAQRRVHLKRYQLSAKK